MTRPSVLIITFIVVLATIAPMAGAAISPTADAPTGCDVTKEALQSENRDADPTYRSNTTTSTNHTVNASIGHQLSTVISATTTEIHTEAENTQFKATLGTPNEQERAEAIVERSEELRERAQDIHDEYQEATEAYNDGDLTKDEYAHRLALLNTRSQNLQESLTALQQEVTNVSDLELAAAGYNQSAIDEATANLDTVTGTGTNTLFAKFTGQLTSEVNLETRHGLSIEAASGNSGHVCDVTRHGDATTDITVTHDNALKTARDALPTPPSVSGEWHLTETEIDREDGVYKFEFQFTGEMSTGKADVIVDGSSDTVVDLEAQIDGGKETNHTIEPDDDRIESDELVILVVDGELTPNGTVTVQVQSITGSPVSNATVYVNDDPVGMTDAHGTLTITLPAAESAFDIPREAPDMTVTDAFEDDMDELEMSIDETEYETEFNTDEDNLSIDKSELEYEIDNDSTNVSIPDPEYENLSTLNVSMFTVSETTVEITAEKGDREGALTVAAFGIESGVSEQDAVAQRLQIDAHLHHGTVVLMTTYDGGPAENMTVYVDGDRVGTTDGSGMIQFGAPVDLVENGEVDLTVVKGEFEAEYTLGMVNGTLTVHKDA